MKFTQADPEAVRAVLGEATGPSKDAILLQIESDYLQVEGELSKLPKGRESQDARALLRGTLKRLESRHAAVLSAKTDGAAQLAYSSALADEDPARHSTPARGPRAASDES